jgi:hypothetical protein
MSVGEYKKEELKIQLNHLIFSLLHFCLIAFILSPIYISDGKKLSEQSLVFFPMMSSGEKNFLSKKVITAIFPFVCRYFSITVCCLFTYRIFFHHLPFFRSATNRRKFSSNVAKKENKAFCIVSDDLFIFFPHSSTLVCEIRDYESNFTSHPMSRVGKKGEWDKYRFRTNIYTPAYVQDPFIG